MKTKENENENIYWKPSWWCDSKAYTGKGEGVTLICGISD